MTDQSLALRLLNRNCYDLDPSTPFIPTSPIDGVGHGDYRFRDESGREVHQMFSNAQNTAYTEFGCPGPSSVDYLRRFMPLEELWPVRSGTAWETHHGLKAWSPPEENSWLCPETIEHYFGPSPIWQRWCWAANGCNAKDTRCCSRKRAGRSRAAPWR
jgi:beta-mannosidase